MRPQHKSAAAPSSDRCLTRSGPSPVSIARVPGRARARFVRPQSRSSPSSVRRAAPASGRSRQIDSVAPPKPACSCRARLRRFPLARAARTSVCNGTGARTRQPGVFAICASSHFAFSMSRRSRACRPSTPCSRIRNHNFKRAEPPAERQSPIAIILDLTISGGLQVTRIRGHHAHEMLGIAHEINRTVEDRAEPFVRVDDQRVGALDALPHPAALRQDHRRAGHGRIDVQPDAVRLSRHVPSLRSDRARSMSSFRSSRRSRTGWRPFRMSSCTICSSDSGRIAFEASCGTMRTLRLAESGQHRRLLN